MPGQNYKSISDQKNAKQPSNNIANSPSVIATEYTDPIQNNCKYGYVLPDRCRFMRHKGCECGAYAPQYWDGERWHSGTE